MAEKIALARPLPGFENIRRYTNPQGQVIAKLLPITEGAVVAQGLRSGPVRAGQTGMSVAYYGKAMTASHRVAAAPVGTSAAAGGAAAVHPAAAAATAATGVATRAVRGAGTRASNHTRESHGNRE